MKITTILFTVFRSLLAFFGIGQGNCLYYPSCSVQIKNSIEEKGLIITIPLILERIYKCNPIYRKFGKNWQ
jgi:putative component of membrane protein insertase Oxa1/YidC/SpoIIIJ protein YidD